METTREIFDKSLIKDNKPNKIAFYVSFCFGFILGINSDSYWDLVKSLIITAVVLFCLKGLFKIGRVYKMGEHKTFTEKIIEDL